MQDKHGNEVQIGDLVRVLEIYDGFLASLEDDERPHIEAMLGKEYIIDDLPEDNKASVSIIYQLADGYVGHGGLYMLSHEFELVRKAPQLVF